MIQDDHYSKFHDLVDEYEEIIQTLTKQVEYYKDQHVILKSDISDLIRENTSLTENLKEKLVNESQIVLNSKQVENEIIENLKQQIEQANQEKEYISDLWQSALQTIDGLEEELKIYQGRAHGYVPKSEINNLKKKYESQIVDLKDRLLKTEKSVQTVVETSRATLQQKAQDLEEALLDQRSLYKTVKKQERDISQLSEKLEEIEEMKMNLERVIKEKDFTIQELERKLCISRSRVEEAVQLVEAALIEKDGALLREKNAIEEVAKSSKTLTEMVEETEEKIRNETELLKARFDINLSKYQMEISSKNDEIKELKQELEHTKKECKLMEEQVNRLQKGNICLDESNTSKLLLLEKNLESTFQKLLLSEKRLATASAEKESIKEDMEQMSKHYEQEIAAREMQNKSLQFKVKKLQDELHETNENLVHFSKKVVELDDNISSMDMAIRKQYELKDIDAKQIVIEKIKQIQDLNSQLQEEMRAKLEKQMEINRKWKQEFCTVTQTLESRLRELKLETKKLKMLNKELTQQLASAESQAVDYKSSFEKLCRDVNVIAIESNKS